MTLSVLLAVAVLLLVGGMPTGAAASTVGSGTMAATPVVVAASSSGLTLKLRYTAPSSGLSAGIVMVTIPRGWSPPQKEFILPEGLCSGDRRLAADIAPKHKDHCSQSVWWVLAHDQLLASNGSSDLSGFEILHEERAVCRDETETTR